jgi:rhodanese-related sulfurtransferase
MQRPFRQPVFEAVGIVVASVLLGFTYTAFSGKGLFGPPRDNTGQVTVPGETSSTFITYEEALDYFEKGKALFIDARHEYDYNVGHIPGALNLPLKEVENRHHMLSSIAKDKLLITYCDGAECNSSVELASKLYSEGFSNVKIFFGGWNEWTAHQRQTEKQSK